MKINVPAMNNYFNYPLGSASAAQATQVLLCSPHVNVQKVQKKQI